MAKITHSWRGAKASVAAPRGVTTRSTLYGAMFLMATSAIGPGFITQTAEFTAQLGAAFAFAILVTVLVDIAVQLNVWRVIGVSGLRAQDIANRVVPGAGYVLAGLVVLGGLLFNVGNVAGASLGLDALLGLEPKLGGALSAIVAIGIFLSRRAGIAMDRVVIVLGFLMIALTLYVAVVSDPPVGEALRQTVLPDEISFLVLITLIGGTVGGYITYAGAHRMLDSGVSGPAEVRRITRSSVTGIVITGVMRAVLFLAVLGVVAGGATLATDNPPASAFAQAAGEVGLRLFGVVLWAAGISSVIGASYTSISFLKTFSSVVARREGWAIGVFIALCALVFVAVQQDPTTLLIFGGAVNGLVLPIGLGVLLWAAARRPELFGSYRYPTWLIVIGALACALTVYFGYASLEGLSELWM